MWRKLFFLAGQSPFYPVLVRSGREGQGQSVPREGGGMGLWPGIPPNLSKQTTVYPTEQRVAKSLNDQVHVHCDVKWKKTLPYPRKT